ncbi:uncharacterized protein BO97DRAFT_251610 [Aspergillus homomorphus CBS 101889]|uniref:Uncharacterized protein n=1 Tax=Aspergillus homomorphus (strain CBS 101889) TaxID=1450537 RepID=A0A395HME7_ASPHC|nr:hypothetical protein BO97DRAFT_251610 [Aspergillus homomorphus CBS 101889]RAL07444.1 hypothetical protein BO97DRAFT_251610 [Aspergillus homomorphus CBS 101889]
MSVAVLISTLGIMGADGSRIKVNVSSSDPHSPVSLFYLPISDTRSTKRKRRCMGASLWKTHKGKDSTYCIMSTDNRSARSTSTENKHKPQETSNGSVQAERVKRDD